MLYKSSGIGIKNENISNQLPLDLAHEAKVSDPTRELAEEIHKKIIGKLKKIRSPFIDNIWDADLADIPFIGKFNKGLPFLLRVIDIFSKYARVIALKDYYRGIIITNAFQKS